MSSIVDQFGRPIKKEQLDNVIAEAKTTGVRNIWGYGSEAQWLTPSRLATILRNAAQGDADAYLTLAEECEERDLHYASVLGTRKRAVSGLPVIVEAASDSAEHIKQADFIRQVVALPEFSDARDDLLDAIGKGYSVVELNYDTRKQPWLPRNRYAQKGNGDWGEVQGFTWRDPRFFMFDRVTGQELRLKDESASFDGLALPQYRFIVHRPRLKTGLPIRGGLARLVIIGLMCKWYSITDWLAFAEIFGMPLRVGKYGPNATAEDIQTLVNAIANIGTDAAAAIPESMKIDFESPSNTTGGAELFQNLAEWVDRQVSKAVLGQTASTEGTAGRLGNDDLQADVRNDILKSDAKQIDNTLNRDLVRALIDLNFGVQDEYPRIVHQIIEPEDMQGLVDATTKAVSLGVEIEASWLRDKIGAPEPDKGAKLLQAPSYGMGFDVGLNHALNQQRPTSKHPLDATIPQRLLDQAQDNLAPATTAWIDQIRALSEQVNSLEELQDKLLELYPSLSLEDYAAALAEASAAANLAGRDRVSRK